MSETVISFIMPARNVADYISDAIRALLESPFADWELIVIDDHCSDNTQEVLKDLVGQDNRVRVAPNVGYGQVAALNHGYTLARGNIIKCIDADDRLDPRFFEHIGRMSQCDAMCHDSLVTSNSFRPIGKYAMDRSFFTRSFAYCLKYLKGLPRWTWSFTRQIGDRVFPIPMELRFEDVWFSLVIKRYAGTISHIDEALYHYRQRAGQTFGGVLNFSQDITVFRARIMLELLGVIEGPQGHCLTESVASDGFFDEVRLFYRMLSKERISLLDICSADMPHSLRMKLLVYRRLRFLAPSIVRLKWLMDGLRQSPG